MSTSLLLVISLACAITWIGLAGYALSLGRQHSATRPLLWLSVISAAWTFSLVKPETLPTPLWLALSHAAEAARLLAWWVLVQATAGYRLIHGQQGLVGLRRFQWLLLACLVLILYSGASHLAGLPALRLSVTAMAFVIASLLPLVAMEQLFRNMDQEQRWAIKFFVLALVASTAMDVITHLHTLLYARVDLQLWLARAPVGLVTALLMGAGLRRLLRLPAMVSLSHQLVFYTGTLVTTSLALFLLAAGAWYIRRWGGAWSTVFLALFISAGLAVLASALLSGRFRAWLQVFLSRHFLPYRYDHRMEWLRLSETLARAAEQNSLPITVVQALANIVDSPAGLLFLVRDKQLLCQADWNLPAPQQPLPLDDTTRARMHEQQWILDRDRDDAADIPDWMSRIDRSWLAVPLLDDHGPVAVVVLAHPRARRRLNWEDYDLLRVAARQAGAVMALQLAGDALGQARQFAALHQSTAFLAHDIKTMIAQLSLLARNAERHRDNPAFVDDMIETVQHSVEKMEDILAQLRQPSGGVCATECSAIALLPLLQDTVRRLSRFQPSPTLETDDDPGCVQARHEDLVTVLNHLVRNAQQACDDSGSVHIRAFRDNGDIVIEVQDSGRGMSPAFIRDNLFTPFHSTRGVSGMGIGVFQSRSLIEAMGGSLSVDSREGVGSCFTIRLPAAEPANRDEPL
ncbi:MAG: PEP-CTERM system histidine kinase PrsK [Alcanivoracaceae bacterium]|nr:PEP-CTERM system histidine kinase PrsK [Alcanivoracaceae bacterium]